MRRNSPLKAYKIYQVVYSKEMCAYARTIYGSNYKDTLGKAYKHVLENFDSNKGDLEHYVISVIHTINLSSMKKEMSMDEATNIALDAKAFDENSGDPQDILLTKIQEEEVSQDLKSCVNELIPMYILDFKYFKSQKKPDRTLDYAGLMSKYSAPVMLSALKYIQDEYFPQIEALYTNKRNLRLRDFGPERIKNSLDSNISFVCEYNDVVLYKKHDIRNGKVIYEINIKDTLKRLFSVLSANGYFCKIGDIQVYLSLSGKIIFNEKELFVQLEQELMGFILARLQTIKVLVHMNEKYALLSSSTPLKRVKFVINLGDVPFEVGLKMRVSKYVD